VIGLAYNKNVGHVVDTRNAMAARGVPGDNVVKA